MKISSLTELFIKCINIWLRSGIYSKLLPVPSLLSCHSFGFIIPQDKLRFLRRCRHLLPTANLTANHCNCMHKLWFRTLTLQSNVWKFDSMVLPHFSEKNIRNYNDHLCSLCMLICLNLNFILFCERSLTFFMWS